MKVSKKLILALSCCCVLTLSMTGCSLFECKHEETVVENQVTATCANPGYTGDKKCTECGELIEAGLSTAALEHQISVTDSKEATCKEEGFTGNAVCDVCGTTVTPGEVIAMIQHEGEILDAKEATCQEPGYSGDTKCKLCGEVYQKGIVIDVVDHDWVEKEVQVQATCKQEGKHTVECRFCLATMDEKVEKLEHEIVTDPSVEATCTTAGKTEGKRCAVCKTVIQKQSVIKALGHDVVTTTKGVEPTCTKDGKASVSRCQRCNEQLTNGETLKASGHKEVKTDAITATCTSPGKTEGSTCSVCKTVIKEATSIAATGHKNVANEEVAATCEKEGKKGGQHCSVCNTVTTESTVIPALGHTPKVVEKKDATCTEEGYTGDEVCEVCNKTLKKGEKVEMIAHTIKDVGNAVPATCTEEGRTSDKICTACETVVEAGVPIPALEHEYVVQEGTAKESTCTEFGHEDNSICRLCADVKEGDRIAKKPHTRVEAPETAIEATCQEKGKRPDIVCAECGKTLSKGKTTKTVPCVAVEGNDAVESTCSVAGHTNSQICKWCERIIVEGEPLPLAPHTPAERGAVAATCTEKGKTAEVYCTVCEVIITESEETETLPHTPIKTGTDVEPTCTAPGMIYGTICDVCALPLSRNEEVPQLDHYYTNKNKCLSIVIDTETYQTAIVKMQCDGCFEKQEFVGMVTDVKIVTEPTCEKEGLLTCTVTVTVSEELSHIYTNVESKVPVIPHTIITVPGKAPTCTEDGYSDSTYCSVCEAPLTNSEVIPARHMNFSYNKHQWDADYPEQNQQDGCVVSIVLTCNDCGEEFTVRASIVDIVEEKTPTCTESGFIKYNLLIKSDKFSNNYIVLTQDFAAKKHIVSNFPEYVNGNAPSYNLQTNEIYCTLTCDECAVDFTYFFGGSVAITEEPTCEDRGTLEINWYVNTETIRVNGPCYSGHASRLITANGHTYDNEENPDLCTVCGTYKSLMHGNWWKAQHTDGYLTIETVIIQKEVPEEETYVESWNVDRDDDGYLKAFLVDDRTVILSTMGADKLYLGTQGNFVKNFINLTTINGLDMVDVSNCDSLIDTFAGCALLVELDLTTWATEKETIELKNTFRGCAELHTITTTAEFAEKISAPSDMAEGEVDNTFLDCNKLVGTVTYATGEVVTEYDADNVGALAATVYFTYSTLPSENPEDA